MPVNVARKMQNARKEIVKEQQKQIKAENKRVKDVQKRNKKATERKAKYIPADVLKAEREKQREKYTEEFNDILDDYNIWSAIHKDGGEFLADYGISNGMPLSKLIDICSVISAYSRNGEKIDKNVLELFNSPDLTNEQKELICDVVHAYLNQGNPSEMREYGLSRLITISNMLQPEFTPEEIQKAIDIVMNRDTHADLDMDMKTFYRIETMHALTELKSLDNVFTKEQMYQLERAEEVGISRWGLMRYAHPEYSVERMIETVDAFERGLDEERIDYLTRPELSEQDFMKLAYAFDHGGSYNIDGGMSIEQVEECNLLQYSLDQAKAIVDAYNYGLDYEDISIILDSKLSGKQMSALVNMLEHDYDHSDILEIMSDKTKLDKLETKEWPDKCYALHPDTHEIIILKPGEDGFYFSDYTGTNWEENQKLVNQLNAQECATPEQVMGMMYHAQHGWHEISQDIAEPASEYSVGDRVEIDFRDGGSLVSGVVEDIDDLGFLQVVSDEDGYSMAVDPTSVDVRKEFEHVHEYTFNIDD